MSAKSQARSRATSQQLANLPISSASCPKAPGGQKREGLGQGCLQEIVHMLAAASYFGCREGLKADVETAGESGCGGFASRADPSPSAQDFACGLPLRSRIKQILPLRQSSGSGFRLQAPGRLRLPHACIPLFESRSFAFSSGFRVRAPARPLLKAADPSRKTSAQDFACRLPVGCASLTPAKRLKMQRGTFEGSLAVRSIRKRPDARHFVWHGLLHPLCQSIVAGNKRLSRAAEGKSR